MGGGGANGSENVHIQALHSSLLDCRHLPSPSTELCFKAYNTPVYIHFFRYTSISLTHKYLDCSTQIELSF